MPLTISFQLSDRDLEHFSARMREARQKASAMGEDGILGSTEKMLSDVRNYEMPDFVRERIDKLELLVKILKDDAWNLKGEDRSRIIDAIAYTADPQDMVPDHIPGIGLLDDAIMIELVSQDLRHDVEAYQDFCKYREKELARRGTRGGAPTQTTFLETRRVQLHDRMRRRREALFGGRGGRGI